MNISNNGISWLPSECVLFEYVIKTAHIYFEKRLFFGKVEHIACEFSRTRIPIIVMLPQRIVGRCY